MNIAPFDRSHTERCIEIFLTNQGKFFDPGELAMFRAYLKDEGLTEDFHVIAGEDGVIGCGGWDVSGEGQVDLSWGMVHRDFHGRGYGKALLEYRLREIVRRYGDVVIRVETSQHTKGFFERYGFGTDAVRIDGYGPGIDYVLMTRKTGGCSPLE